MRTVSLNAAYLVLFKNPRDKLQIMTLGKQMYPGKTKQFIQKYEAAVQRPYGYLFVDLKPNTPEGCRLRTNVLPNDQTVFQADPTTTISQYSDQSVTSNPMTDFFQRQSFLQSSSKVQSGLLPPQRGVLPAQNGRVRTQITAIYRASIISRGFPGPPRPRWPSAAEPPGIYRPRGPP